MPSYYLYICRKCPQGPCEVKVRDTLMQFHSPCEKPIREWRYYGEYDDDGPPPAGQPDDAVWRGSEGG